MIKKKCENEKRERVNGLLQLHVIIDFKLLLTSSGWIRNVKLKPERKSWWFSLMKQQHWNRRIEEFENKTFMLESCSPDPAAETLVCSFNNNGRGRVLHTLAFYTLLLHFSLGCTNPNPHILGFFYFISIGSKLKVEDCSSPIQNYSLPYKHMENASGRASIVILCVSVEKSK